MRWGIILKQVRCWKTVANLCILFLRHLQPIQSKAWALLMLLTDQKNLSSREWHRSLTSINWLFTSSSLLFFFSFFFFFSFRCWKMQILKLDHYSKFSTFFFPLSYLFVYFFLKFVNFCSSTLLNYDSRSTLNFSWFQNFSLFIQSSSLVSNCWVELLRIRLTKL